MNKPEILKIILIMILWSLFVISILQLLWSFHEFNNTDTSEFKENFEHIKYENNDHYFINTGFKDEYTSIIEIERSCDVERHEITDNSSKTVYVYSGSSMVTPFCEDSDIPKEMEKLLRERQKNYEIYNLAMSGARSSSILRSVNKSINLKEPDAVMIYSGHNDHIEAHNVLREEMNFVENNLLWKVYRNTFARSLDNYEIKGVSRDLLTPKLARLGLYTGLIDSEKTMEMIEITNRKARENYKRNIEKLVELTEERDIDLFLSTVSSNLKIEPQTESFYFENRSVKKNYESYMEIGIEFLNRENYHAALENFRKAYDINNKSSKAPYYLGKTHENLDNNEKAINYLVDAKNRDNFSYDVRAKSDINEYLREINESHVTTIDLKKILKETEELLNDDLFADWLHYETHSNNLIAEHLVEGLETYKK